MAVVDRMNRPPQLVDLLRAGIQAKLGNLDAAKIALARFLEYRPGWNIAKERTRITFRRPNDEKRWLGALVEAGLPND